MVKTKNITIISTNSLISIGLKSILIDYFSLDAITIANGYDDFLLEEAETSPDIIFLPSDLYVIHDYFQNIKNKVVILIEKNEHAFTNQTALSFLDTTLSQSEIVDSLNRIFDSKIKAKLSENPEGLSARETEVLKLVARGHMNKQIADILSISLHTVISHRKNMTRKLGINTVSGLTVYAILNGLISTTELGNESFNV